MGTGNQDHSTADDAGFLAKLVHRGHLERGLAGEVAGRLSGGESLEQALSSLAGWSPERVAELRATDAGERPVVPGYTIEALLGVGGTARVFGARHGRTGRRVALKVLDERMAEDPAAREAFLHEAKLLKRLEHPGLVRGHGAARAGERFLSVLEWVPGETLLERIDRSETLSEDDALRVVLAVAEALEYLATQGLVHRDVKAGNVMVEERAGGELHVKLIDLGFAAQAGDVTADADRAVGTVAYLAPEQARGGAAADVRSDIYSLGVTLFQCIAGRLPFEGDGDDEVIARKILESLSSPELKRRGTSPQLHYLVEKMMSRDADHRFPSFAALIADVREQLEGHAELDFRSMREGARRSPRRKRR